MATKRPRIFLLAGMWLCIGDGIGIGASPRDAYEHWYATRCIEA